MMRAGRSRPLAMAAILLFTASGLAAAAPDQSQLTPQIDALFAPWSDPESAGLMLAVIKDGQVVYEKAYGTANLETGTPISAHTVFDIGSMSKQFTAFSVLLLEQQGKLLLDDDIRKYFPELPDYGHTITIRHCLNHTSGLRDYFELRALAGMRYENYYSDAEMLSLIARQTGLNFAPGEKHLYCNSGFFLMGQLVQRVSGQSLARFAEENIFKPLGMSAFYADDPHRLVKHRAIGYFKDPSVGWFNAFAINGQIGDGGIHATVDDLAKWDANWYQNKLGGGQEAIAKLSAAAKLNSGEAVKYGLGLMLNEYKGLRMVYHGGNWMGYTSEMVRFPEQKFTVIILSNVGLFPANPMCLKVADLYLADQLAASVQPGATAQTAAPKFVSVPASELRKFEGSYRNPVTGTIWDISPADSILQIQTSTGFQFTLAPIEGGRFASTSGPVAVDVAFASTESSDAYAINGTVNNVAVTLQPVRRPKADEIDLAHYAGQYSSSELDATYSLRVENNQLVLEMNGNGEPAPLQPVLIDEFSLQGGLTFQFSRDASGQISGFEVNTPRTKHVQFRRESKG